MEKINSEYLKEIMVILMELDKTLTYDVLAAELSISRRDVWKMKKGEDMYIRYYIAMVCFILEAVQLTFDIKLLVKELRKVLCERQDLLIAAVPRKRGGAYAPQEWKVLMRWG